MTLVNSFVPYLYQTLPDPSVDKEEKIDHLLEYSSRCPLNPDEIIDAKIISVLSVMSMKELDLTSRQKTKLFTHIATPSIEEVDEEFLNSAEFMTYMKSGIGFVCDQFPEASFYREADICDISTQTCNVLQRALRDYVYNMDMIRYYVEELNIDVNTPNSKGVKPLEIACMSRHLEAIKYLLDHGADVTNKCYEEDNTIERPNTHQNVLDILEVYKEQI